MAYLILNSAAIEYFIELSIQEYISRRGDCRSKYYIRISRRTGLEKRYTVDWSVYNGCYYTNSCITDVKKCIERGTVRIGTFTGSKSSAPGPSE